MSTRVVLSCLVAGVMFAGCAAPELTEGDERGSTSSREKIVRAGDVLARAQEWVDKRVPYCGGVRGGSDVLCGGTCNRPAAAWDGYRSDCSGYVSWAWQIPDVPTTYVYIDDRGGENGWVTVPIDDAQPGDALVSETHIKLLSKVVGAGAMEIYEESDCGLVAARRTQNITRTDRTHFLFAGDNRAYHVIRRNGIQGGGGGEESVAEGSQSFITAGEQHYFTRGEGGELNHAYWLPSDRQVHHDVWGQGIAGDPAALIYGDQQHAFARGTGGTLEHWWWTRGDKKMSHDVWGQGLASDPAVILMGGGQHAFATDASGNLRHWYWTPDGKVKADTWGDGVEGRPSALATPAEQHVFAKGKDGALHHFWWEPKEGLHRDVWADAIASEPAARNINDDQHVFAVDASGALQHWWWGPKTKTITHDTWSEAGTFDPTTRPTLMTQGYAQHVFGRSEAGALEHVWWSPDGEVRHDTWGEGLATSPTAILIGDDQHVFAQNATGGIEHWWWSEKAGITHDQW